MGVGCLVSVVGVTLVLWTAELFGSPAWATAVALLAVWLAVAELGSGDPR